ncbi:MAG: hypothetical protein IT371_04385 [Deltaproteobacteria bacterium]|nr:hypothetical protein [Deltaproteobacteria bacterium]
MRRHFMGVLAASALVGCSSTSSTAPDAAVVHDTGAVADAGAAADRGAGDARSADTGSKPDGSADPCALSPLRLAAEYCTKSRTTVAQVEGVGLAGQVLYTFGPKSLGKDEFEVRAATLDGSLKPGTPSVVFSFTPTGTAKRFASWFVPVSTSGVVAVGYTEEKTFAGALYLGKAGQTPTVVDKANGNFDAVWLDADTLLVAGLGVAGVGTGNAVYAVPAQGGKTPQLLVKDLGSVSGYLASGKDVVVVSAFDLTSHKYAFRGFSTAELKAAAAAGKSLSFSADADSVYLGNASDVTMVGDRLLVVEVDQNFKFSGVKGVTVQVSGDKVSGGAGLIPVIDVGGGVEVTRIVGDGSRFAVLMGDVQKPELAIIEKK